LNWGEVIEQISYMFQVIKPSMLETEIKKFQQLSPQAAKDSGVDSEAQRLRQFEKTVAQSTLQLSLTRLVAQIVQKFFDQL